MKLTLLVLPVWLLGFAGAALAGEPHAPAVPAGEAGTLECHVLMTEQECAAHLTQLALLPDGPRRTQYLVQYLNTRRERETLCTCSNLSKPVVYYPSARQAVLRF